MEEVEDPSSCRRGAQLHRHQVDELDILVVQHDIHVAVDRDEKLLVVGPPAPLERSHSVPVRSRQLIAEITGVVEYVRDGRSVAGNSSNGLVQ